MVVGSATMSGTGSATVLLAGSSAFSTVNSYRCTASVEAPGAPSQNVRVQRVSGVQFTLWGNKFENVSFICVGN